MASPAPACYRGSLAHKLHAGVGQAYRDDVWLENYCLVQFHKSHIIAEVCWTVLGVHLYQRQCQEANSLKQIGHNIKIRSKETKIF